MLLYSIYTVFAKYRCWLAAGGRPRIEGIWSRQGKNSIPGGYQPTTYNQLAYKIEDTKLQRDKDAKDAKDYKDYKDHRNRRNRSD